MSADTQALWDAMVRDFGAGREMHFQGRLAELMSQYVAEREQRGLFA